MKAGKLVHLVSVLRRQPGAVNTYGTPMDTWPVAGALRAELVELEGHERIAAAGASDMKAVQFRVRGHLAVTTEDRIAFRGQTYRVKDAHNDPRGRWQLLTCEAGPGVA